MNYLGCLKNRTVVLSNTWNFENISIILQIKGKGEAYMFKTISSTKGTKINVK